MPAKTYAIAHFMNYLMDERHQPGQNHCCRDYVAITDDYVIYEFADLEAGTVFKLGNHMLDVKLIEDADGQFGKLIAQAGATLKQAQTSHRAHSLATAEIQADLIERLTDLPKDRY